MAFTLTVYVDTNVAASLFLPDALTAKAERATGSLFEGLVVSDYMAAEFAAVVGRHFNRKLLSLERAKRTFAAFDIWWATRAVREPVLPQDIQSAERIVRQLHTGLRAPDAIHAAMAARLGAKLLTFDRKLAAAASALGITVVPD